MAHTEESPELIVMPQGPETFAGRYPGYKPAQAMAAFLNVPHLHRLSYDVLVDSCWGISFQHSWSSMSLSWVASPSLTGRRLS